MNLYNNPVYYVDPSGNICEPAANRIREKIANNTASKNERRKLAAYERHEARKRGEAPAGYYKDSNGRWHRPNGEFAKNVEVSIQGEASKNANSSHGNSLNDTRTNYGYALVDKNTSEILKFGETLYPNKRYSQNYLNSNNAVMKVLEKGSKVDIHLWQHDMNEYFKVKYGEYPKLNRKGW